MIRIPDQPQFQGTPVNAPRLSVDAATAPLQGLGQLAQSVASVGNEFQRMADQTQKLENGRVISDARQRLAEKYSAFQQELDKDPDPTQRVSKTRAFFTDTMGGLAPADAPEAVRAALREYHDDLGNRAVLQQGEQAGILTHKRATLALANEIETAGRNGDRQGFERAVATGEQAGIVLPEHREKLQRGFDREVAFTGVLKEIDANPLLTEKRVNGPDFLKENPALSFEDQQRLLQEAEQKANRYRNDWSNEIIIGGIEPTLEQLKYWENAGQLSKSQHAQFASKIRNREVPPVSDPALYNEAYGQVVAYDPSKDPTGRTEATLRTSIAAMPLPPAELQALNGKLSEMAKPVKTQTRNTHEAAFAGRIQTDFTQGTFGKYRFPVDSDGDPSTPPTTPINPGAYDSAWKLRGKFEDQWRGIIAGLPKDAGFEDVSKAYDALKISFKGEMPLPDLGFSKPKPLPFVPGTTYQNLPGKRANFGGQAIKPPGIPFTGAAATVFGGKADSEDNGLSAFGGKTGEGGKEGTAIPQAVLAAQFPGRPKAWLSENVRTVVTGPDGVKHSLQVADLGTAERIWQRAGRPTLDLTEGAVKRLGGKVSYTAAGKLAGVKGLDSLDFAVVSINTGGKKLTGMSWTDARQAWFTANRPTSNQQIDNSLIALRDAWATAQMDAPDDKPADLPGKDPNPDAWKTEGPLDVPQN